MADLGSGTTLPSSPPANPGDTFFDANVAKEKVWNGSAWLVLGGGGSSGGNDVTIVGSSVSLGITTDGVAATGVAHDTGGSGTIGWLSSTVKNLRTLAGTVTGTTVKVLSQAGTAIIGKVGIDQTTPGTTNGVQINAAIPAGAAIIGKVGIDQTTPGTTNAISVDGTAATGVTHDAGGAGAIGWLSSAVANLRTAVTSLAAIAASVAGTLSTICKAGTAALTSVASSATTVVLLASNNGRKGFAVYNESTAVLYLAYAATASATAYTVQVPASGYYEVLTTVYTGAVSGFWASANGSARITELT